MLAAVLQGRHGAGEGGKPLAPLFQRGDGGNQPLGVGVQGMGQHLLGFAAFHHPAGVHNVHPAAHLADDAQVVGNQQHGGAHLPVHVPDELHNLGLDGHIQRGGGLVGDEQLRLVHQGHGNHHTLAHAAGEPVGILVVQALHIGQAHLAHDFQSLFLGHLFGVPVDAGVLRDLPAHLHQGV